MRKAQGSLFLKLIFSFFLLSSCAQKEKVNEVTLRPGIHLCFQLIVQNNLTVFKDHILECKAYRNSKGMTSLMMAVGRDNNDFAEYLMEQGADVNALDDYGMAALVFAANRNNARLTQLLRRHGARIELVKDNLTGLMIAVRNSSFELIRVMNPTEDEINIRADDGWSAIYFAIRREDPQILKFLIEGGACLKAKDSYDQTPLDFAKEVKWKAGIALLQKKTKC